MSIQAPPKKYLWLWLLWLALFFAAWAWLAFGLGHWHDAKEHWPIALAMTFGSYVAGSTPMGGGTVGFPVLVLFFEMPATLGRDFSFAIQSIGMTSAAIFIFARRQPLAWATLHGALVGSLIGTPLGLYFVAPYVPELWIKVVFAIIWASFGVLHLYRIREISAHTGMTDLGESWDFKIGLMAGLFAALTVVSVTGVGIDMVVYSTLVLLCRADLKIAIPTSVVIMAFTSVVGLVFKLSTDGMQPGVYENWLIAAPVVALGAPLGVFVVGLIGRKPTLLFVAVLCVLQFIWTCKAEYPSLGASGVALASIAVLLCLFALEQLRRSGDRLVKGLSCD